MSTTPHDVKDLSLAAAGQLRIDWAELSMPVLRQVRERFKSEQPLRGVRIGACLHVTTETAVLMLTLKAGGASVALCASNPLSTQDDVAAALVHEHAIPVYAQKGEDHQRYYQHIKATLDTRPNVTMDDGADLISELHGKRREPRSRTSSAGPRRRPRASSGSGRWRRRACSPSRSSRSTTPIRSTCSTTATGPVSPRSTGSCGPPTSSSPAARSSWRASGCAAAASPPAPTAWGRASW